MPRPKKGTVEYVRYLEKVRGRKVTKANHQDGLRRIRRSFGIDPDCIVVCGVGHGDEFDTIHATWPDARVIGFEPQPDLAKLAADRYTDAEIIESALSTSRYVRLERATGHATGASIHHRRCGGADVRLLVDTYKAITGSEFLAWKGPIKRGLMLLDCEGAELDVLRSFHPFELNDFHWISVEVTFLTTRGTWPSAKQVFATMDELEYNPLCVGWQSYDMTQVDVLFERKRLHEYRAASH